MNWLELFKALVETEELDPVYTILYRARKDVGDDAIKRFLVGQMCYYNVGLSAELSDVGSDRFWEHVQALYPTCKRGSERRHFRGENGRKSIASMMQYGSPEAFFDKMYAPTYAGIRKNFDKVSGFGPYFQWKALDFFERIMGMPVDASDAWQHLPKEPFKGLALVAKEEGLEGLSVERQLATLVESAQGAGLQCPPDFKRLVGIQELETLLCAYIHYHNGTYRPGEDIDRCYDLLSGVEGLGRVLIQHVPEKVTQVYPKYGQKVVEETSGSLFDMFA